LKILKNTFGKEEKLCSEKDIDTLYKSGTSFLSHPIVIYYSALPELQHSKAMVSVSKKKFKRAVDRNLLKRRLREAYRLNKRVLTKNYHLAFVYIGHEMLPFTHIEKALIAGLTKISQETEGFLLP
jgi:ribonuclease P protein component